MKKILFFDIDGTLYDHDKKLPESAKKAVMAAREKGHLVAIATGRAPFMVGPVLEDLDIDTYICFNGQYVVHEGKLLYGGIIEPEILARIKEKADRDRFPLIFMDDREMVATETGHPHVGDSLNSLKMPYPRASDTFYMERPIHQALLFCTEHQEQAYVDAFPEMKFVRWHEKSTDILPSGTSKAEGMQRILELEGLTMADAIAFGDGLNDIEMLEAAGIGVAMGNAHEKAKERADYIAGDVSEDGIARILDRLKLI
ncbi:Cof-type HAD-IIB family hydrolase [Bhargavaea massiliensis]|uniref:Cof-type HAD-IIB family hydrolase n=1 Tax=Bhargavaea massiliensis TaxID=2697500 RepID=UPI001BCEB0F5|nr:Cof-type HAD-IIB family hydrolase [Bhargavaea massiliensis]